MASLIPLLHDLLPIFMPAEVRVARDGELAAVEERAERPPWYQQRRTSPRAAMSKNVDSVGDSEKTTQHGDFEPIQLLDNETGASKEASDDHGTAASPLKSTGEHGPVPSHVRGGPKVSRKDAMVGVSDKMCVTGKPRRLSQRLFRCFLLVVHNSCCYEAQYCALPFMDKIADLSGLYMNAYAEACLVCQDYASFSLAMFVSRS